MSQLTVIAKLKAKSGAEEKLYEECRKLIAPTLAEEGCINYDMYRSTEDSGSFMFYENWASRPHWERHMESPHLKAFPNNTEGMGRKGGQPTNLDSGDGPEAEEQRPLRLFLVSVLADY